MGNSIKIVSDGTPFGTQIYNDEGRLIDGVTDIKLHIGVDSLMEAVLVFTNVELETVADWSNHPFKLWADRKTGAGAGKIAIN